MLEASGMKQKTGLALFLFHARRKYNPAMTTNLFKADADMIESLLQKESALYKEAMKKDVPFKFIKAIRQRIRCLSDLLVRKKGVSTRG